MKGISLRRRALSLALVLTLLLAAVPAAHAAQNCPSCASANCTITEVKAANCHETGVDKYVCAACGRTNLVETAVDPDNHDAYCTDNGDGETHTATCPYHPDYASVKERHLFADGRCRGCAAVDYDKVSLSVVPEMELHVNLNDTAVVSLGAVSLSVGQTDVTAEYTLRYNWYLNGEPVGSGETYQLPAGLVAAEGDYNLVCFVMAVAKNGISTENAACTVTVHVQDMVAAHASITTRDLYFTMGETGSRFPVSAAEQIYQAFFARTGTYPEYVVFGDKPTSPVGALKCSGDAYYFMPTAGQQALGGLRFESTRSAAGRYTIPFTVYGPEEATFPGVLTITVEQDLGDMNITCSTTSGSAVKLSAADFDAFWQKTYPQGRLTLVRFPSLPSAGQGTLCTGYVSPLRTGTAVGTTDSLFRVPEQGQLSLDDLTFRAAAGFTGYVVLPFEANGENNRGVQTYLSGNVFIFVTAGAVTEVTAEITAGTEGNLSAADFMAVHRKATGSADTGFYIQLLDAPVRGALYMGRSESASGTRLTAANIARLSLHYANAAAAELEDVTYVPGADGESLRYAAYDAKGNLLYLGRLTFTIRQPAVYTKSFTDVVSTDWFYTYVMDLAEAGVINGMTDTTYVPDSEVTYAQALKLILLAAGYDEQAPTGSHWASGYLAAAHRDGLLSSSVTESHLDRKIARYAIAEIAARALKLPKPTTTVSPFSDMEMSNGYAPYVLALYEAKIVEGSPVNGELKYYGVNSIRRSEVAAIIWRINNYTK